MATRNQRSTESEPLLPCHQDPDDISVSHACREQRDPSKGFTLRRCMIVPVFICYFLGGGIYMYEVPQYTQLVMKEQDQQKQTTPPVSPTSNNYSTVRSTDFILLGSDSVAVDACVTLNTSDPSYAQFTKVQQDTAMWTIYFAISSLIPAMFANLIWPTYTDIFGRRFAFVLCLVGGAIRIILFTLVVQFKWSLIFIVIGNFIDGLTGSFSTLFAVTFSFVSDVTYPGKQRTIAIVVFELLLGLTITVACLGCGYFIKYTGFIYPAITSSGLSVLGIVIFIILVPETMQNRNTRGQSRNTRMFKTLGESAKFYFCDGTKIRRIKYILLMMGFLFNGIPSMNRGTLEVLYQLGRPFCWSSTKIGWFGAIKMAVCSLFGIGGTYLFKRCMADDAIATWSVALGAVSYLVEGLATTDAVLYSVALIAAPTGLPFPMIRSIMSCLTPADKQGALFAGIGFVETLCSLIGSVSNNVIYSATLTIMNGFVFLLLGGVMLTGSFFLLAYMIVERYCKDDTEPVVKTIHVNAAENSTAMSS